MNDIFQKLEWTLDDFVAGLWVLPDPDPELRRLGVTTKVYDAIKADPDVKSCIEDRQSTTLLKRWEWVAGDETSDAVALRDAVANLLTPDLMYPHIEAMLSAPLYGMIPVEILWGRYGRAALINDFRPMPTWAVRFDRKRRPVLWHRYFLNPGPIPDGKMVLVRKDHTYQNPYGEKLFSSLFWPVVFRRGGLRFWHEFMDRYGLPRVIAELPKDQYREKRDETAEALSGMVRDAVAVVEEGGKITMSDVRVSGTSDMYDRFQEFVGATISRVITGQVLARDTGRQGSYAQASVHDRTGNRRAMMDEVMIEHAVNRAVRYISEFNRGNIPPPRIQYERPEDLKVERAERDGHLSRMGTHFSRDYIVEKYGFEDGDIDDVTAPGQTFARMGDEQQAIDELVVEQVRKAARITDAQAQRIVRAIKNEGSSADIETILSDIAGDDAGTYSRMMGEVLIAADMYGRSALLEEVGK